METTNNHAPPRLLACIACYAALLTLASNAFAQSAQRTISAAEYSFNAAVAAGSGTPISISDPVGASNLVGQVLEGLPNGALSTGHHVVYLRVQDSDGNWSQALAHGFAVANADDADRTTIVAAEYSFDSIVAAGSGTSIAISDPVDSSNLIGRIVDGLPNGKLSAGHHVAYLRVQDSAGNWSQALAHGFYVATPPVNGAPKIVENGTIDLAGTAQRQALVEPVAGSQQVARLSSTYDLSGQPSQRYAVTMTATDSLDEITQFDSHAVTGDRDSDGVLDLEDNCPDDANADQADFNADTEGDACDDTDGDGMSDAFELNNGFDPESGADANQDADGDGLSNREEFEAGTDPNAIDSDTDGIIDGLDDEPAEASNACTGTNAVLENLIVRSDTRIQCGASVSVLVEDSLTTESGAEVQVFAPEVRFAPGFRLNQGALFDVEARDPGSL